jgi:predicted permease
VLLAVYVVAALAIIALTIAVTVQRAGRTDGVTLRDAAFGALVAAFPNAGFMGVPLLVALLGENAAGPVIGAIVVDLVVTSTVCVAIAQSHSHRSRAADERSMLTAAALSLRGALTNPLPWAIALGAVFAATDRELPAPLAQVVRMLGDSAAPVALFTIGSVLWRAGQHAHTKTPVAHYLPVALIKLLVHPALVLAIGLAARALGASALAVRAHGAHPHRRAAEREQRLAARERYGADNGRIARIIMASTVLAFVTFSATAWLFGVGRGG